MCLEIDENIKIDKNNRRRLENFLNRKDKKIKNPIPLYDVVYIGLTTNRNKLYSIINERVDKMFDEGLLEEVKELYIKYPQANILQRAIGYKEIISYLNGSISLEEAKELIKKNTRHYAKRQYTWFNNQLNVCWFNTDFTDFNKTYEEVINYLENIILK